MEVNKVDISMFRSYIEEYRPGGCIFKRWRYKDDIIFTGAIWEGKKIEIRGWKGYDVAFNVKHLDWWVKYIGFLPPTEMISPLPRM